MTRDQWLVNMTSLYWWASAGLTGIGLSILAYYVRVGFERLATRLSIRARERMARSRKQGLQRLLHLAESADARVAVLSEQSYLQYRSLVALINAYAVITMLLLVPFVIKVLNRPPAPKTIVIALAILGLLCLFIGTIDFLSATRLHFLLRRAIRIDKLSKQP